MQVLIFQIVVFLVISFAGYNGFKSLNIVSAILIIFTIGMVNTSPLMILQFLTIFCAYTFSLKRIQENSNNNSEENGSETYYARKSPPRKRFFLELVIKLLANVSLLILIIYGCMKFTIHYYQDINDIGTFLFASLSYLIVIGIAFLICWYFYINAKENLKEIKSRI